jgi:hypothetical protein
MDLRLHLALYEGAAMNICGGSGKTEFLRFSRAPYIFFDVTRAGMFGEDYYRDFCGIKIGDQQPWQLPHQRIAWIDSTYDNLVREWENWVLPVLSSPARSAPQRVK